MRIVLIFIIAIAGQLAANAADLQDAAEPPSDGTCLPSNKRLWGSGTCQSLFESMTKENPHNAPGCKPTAYKDLMESIRKRIVAGATGKPAKLSADEAKYGKKDIYFGSGFADRPGPGGDHDSEDCPGLAKAAEKDNEYFSQIMVQLFASISEELSGSKIQNGDRTKGGLLDIGDADFKNKDYACGCTNLNSENMPHSSGTDGKGGDAWDSHANFQCGAFKGLLHIAQHNTFYASDPANSDPKKKQQGLAHAFSVLQTTDKDYSNPNAPIRKVMQRWKAFCKSKGGQDGKWKPFNEDWADSWRNSMGTPSDPNAPFESDTMKGLPSSNDPAQVIRETP